MSNMQLTPRLNRVEPNLIIDGEMSYWPEGTSRSVANNTSAYGAVLFKCNNASSGITLTNSQQSSVPSNTTLQASNQTAKTAAGTLAAGTAVYKRYYIEGYDLKRILLNEWSLIFWVKSTVASNRSVSITNIGSTHSYVQQYNISSANTWELKALRFDAVNTCPGTLNRTNGIGLNLTFSIVSGTTFQTSSLNAWQAGNFLAGPGEDTTWLTGTTHDFSITGVMILPGDWSELQNHSSSYEFTNAGKNSQEDLVKSQRYLRKSGMNPASPWVPGVATNAGVDSRFAHRFAGTTDRAAMNEVFSPPLRAGTSVVFYPGRPGVTNTVNRVSVYNADTLVTFTDSSGDATSGLSLYFQNLSTSADQYSFQYIVDARF